jgi:arginine decarboxylase
VRLQESAGRRSAEMVIPYPPGIPVLYPGETITEQALAHLMRLAEAGARFQGVHDTTLASISVYQDTAGVPE